MSRAFSVMASLATCLCAEIAASEYEETCFCGVVPGEAPALSYGSNCSGANGMAWVRLVTVFPADGVAVQSEQPGNCSGGISAVLEVGIMRQVTVGDNRGNPPTMDELLQQAEQQSSEMDIMRRAIVCCPEIPAQDFVLGTYRPIGPQGAMLGGIWEVTVGL